MKTRIKETLYNGRMVFIPQYKRWIFWKSFLKSLMDEDILKDQIFMCYDTFDYVIAFSSFESAKKFIDYERGFMKNSKTIIHKYP